MKSLLLSFNWDMHLQVGTEAGWEFARAYKGPYHSKSDKFDVYKRRRELREMVPKDPENLFQLPVFNFKGQMKSFSLSRWQSKKVWKLLVLSNCQSSHIVKLFIIM